MGPGRPSSLVLSLNDWQMIGAQDPKDVGTPARSRRSALSASAKRLKSGELVKAKIPIYRRYTAESTVHVLCAVAPRRTNITI